VDQDLSDLSGNLANSIASVHLIILRYTYIDVVSVPYLIANVNSEKDILGQIKKYTESDTFNMSIESSTRKIRQPMPPHRICLLGDQHGIYLTVNSEFVGCTATEPRWPRTQLSRTQLTDIREELQKLLNQ
jgi:hypothetical protein